MHICANHRLSITLTSSARPVESTVFYSSPEKITKCMYVCTIYWKYEPRITACILFMTWTHIDSPSCLWVERFRGTKENDTHKNTTHRPVQHLSSFKHTHKIKQYVGAVKDNSWTFGLFSNACFILFCLYNLIYSTLRIHFRHSFIQIKFWFIKKKKKKIPRKVAWK